MLSFFTSIAMNFFFCFSVDKEILLNSTLEEKQAKLDKVLWIKTFMIYLFKTVVSKCFVSIPYKVKNMIKNIPLHWSPSFICLKFDECLLHQILWQTIKFAREQLILHEVERVAVFGCRTMQERE